MDATRVAKGGRWSLPCIGLAVMGTLSPALALEFPREGVAEVPNGVAAPFAGTWWVGSPQEEGKINGAPTVNCDAPVELVPKGENDLLFRAHGAAEVAFELLEFSGRTTWLPKDGASTIVVWVDTNEFFAYSTDIASGKARWEDPSVFRRCE